LHRTATVSTYGSVHAMDANASGCHAPPIKADDEAKTRYLRKEENAEWGRRVLAPFGLLPEVRQENGTVPFECLAAVNRDCPYFP
jgi:hypothetical protein